MSEFVKDPGADAYLKNLIKATSASPAIPIEPSSSPSAPSPSLPESTKSSSKEDGGAGGNGGKGNNGGGGGGSGAGGGFGGFLSRLSTIQRVFFGLALMLLFAVCAQIINLWFLEKTIGYKDMYNKNESKTESPAEKPATEPVVKQTQTIQSKGVINAVTFGCRNDYDREKGYAMKNIQYLDGHSDSLRVGPGCVLSIVKGDISGIEGNGYQFAVEEPSSPGKFYKCGSNHIDHDTSSSCVRFVNAYKGREMRIAVLDGGYVNLN